MPKAQAATNPHIDICLQRITVKQLVAWRAVYIQYYIAVGVQDKELERHLETYPFAGVPLIRITELAAELNRLEPPHVKAAYVSIAGSVPNTTGHCDMHQFRRE